MTKLTPAMGLLTLLALFSGACRAQLYRETGDNETSLMYHLPILKKDSQEIYYEHRETQPNCILEFSFFSGPYNETVDTETLKCRTQVEILYQNETNSIQSLTREIFTRDNDDFKGFDHKLNITQKGLYTIKISNLEEDTILTSIVADLKGCYTTKKGVKKSEVDSLHKEYQEAIDEFSKNLLKRKAMESNLDRRKAGKPLYCYLQYFPL